MKRLTPFLYFILMFFAAVTPAVLETDPRDALLEPATAAIGNATLPR